MTSSTLIVILAGCVRMIGVPDDNAGPVDGSLAENPWDHSMAGDSAGNDIPALNDGALQDFTKSDTPALDTSAAPDTALQDLPVPDTSAPPDSVQQDHSVPDTSLPTDHGTLLACLSTGTQEAIYANGAMVHCGYQVAFTMCIADTKCNTAGGWHLCLASEYKTHGGTTIPSPSPGWISGCIRDGVGPLTAPSDGLCSSCSGPKSKLSPVAWSCTGAAAVSTNEPNLGIVSHSSCQRLGVNTTSSEAYWTFQEGMTKSRGVFCCK